MRTLFYKNIERITVQDMNDMITIFGNHPYNEFIWNDTNDSMDVHIDAAPILFTIQNDNYLNERDIELRERITKTLPKGLTPSSAYYSISVEHNILRKLILDAQEQLKKDCEDNVPIINWLELFRYYGLEFGSMYKKSLEKAKKATANIVKPKKFYDWKCYFSKDQTHENDCNNSYLEYHIDVESTSYELREINKNKNIYKMFPYLGKLYFTTVCGTYLQLYVYDHVDRHWAVNNVLDYLIKNGKVKLKV